MKFRKVFIDNKDWNAQGSDYSNGSDNCCLILAMKGKIALCMSVLMKMAYSWGSLDCPNWLIARCLINQ